MSIMKLQRKQRITKTGHPELDAILRHTEDLIVSVRRMAKLNGISARGYISAKLDAEAAICRIKNTLSADTLTARHGGGDERS